MKQYYVFGGHLTEYLVAYAVVISWEDGNYKYEYFIRSATTEARDGARAAAVQSATYQALQLVARIMRGEDLSLSGVHRFNRRSMANYDAKLLLEYHIQDVIHEHLNQEEGDKEDV